MLVRAGAYGPHPQERPCAYRLSPNGLYRLVEPDHSPPSSSTATGQVFFGVSPSPSWESDGVNVEEYLKNLVGHLRQRIQSWHQGVEPALKKDQIKCLLRRRTVVLAQHATLQSPSLDGKRLQMVNNVWEPQSNWFQNARCFSSQQSYPPERSVVCTRTPAHFSGRV